jgi:hypothetical protein
MNLSLRINWFAQNKNKTWLLKGSPTFAPPYFASSTSFIPSEKACEFLTTSRAFSAMTWSSRWGHLIGWGTKTVVTRLSYFLRVNCNSAPFSWAVWRWTNSGVRRWITSSAKIWRDLDRARTAELVWRSIPTGGPVLHCCSHAGEETFASSHSWARYPKRYLTSYKAA